MKIGVAHRTESMKEKLNSETVAVVCLLSTDKSSVQFSSVCLLSTDKN